MNFRQKYIGYNIFNEALFKSSKSISNLWSTRCFLLKSRYQLLQSLNKHVSITPSNGTDKWKAFIEYLVRLPTKAKNLGEEKASQTSKDNKNNENMSYFKSRNERFYLTQNKCLLKNRKITQTVNGILEIAFKQNANPPFGIGCNLTTIDDSHSMVVLDIDNAFVGNNIINWLKTSDPKEQYWFHNVFGHPVIIKTAREGHLHLWYKNVAPMTMSKIELCCCLGFSIEYTFSHIECISSNRHILYQPKDLNTISVLPRSLYPYSYYQKEGFLTLTQGTPLKPNILPNQSAIVENYRNTFLYKFFRVDNFSEQHVLAANRLLCDPPLETNEIVKSCCQRFSQENPGKIEPDQMRKTYPYFNIENSTQFERISYRISEDQNLKDFCFNPEKTLKEISALLTKQDFNKIINLYKFNPQRTYDALYHSTPIVTISLVAFLEATKDQFFPSDLYLGRNPDTFILNYFFSQEGNKYKIIYISSENQWYLWNGKIWEKQSNEDAIDSYFQNFLEKNVQFGGVEAKFTKAGSYRSILQNQVSQQEWPIRVPIGMTFDNGIVLANDNKECVLNPFDPKYYHRVKFNCNFVPNAQLNLSQLRFFMDLSAEATYHLNVIRYICYLAFTNHTNQIGVYFNSEPGSSKSTFIKLLQRILGIAVVPLNVTDIRNNSSFHADYVAGKKVLVISEPSSNTTKSESMISFINQTVGNDFTNAAQKFRNYYTNSYGVTPLLIFIGNDPAEKTGMYSNDAVKDRLIDFKLPAIKTQYRVTEIEKFVNENAEAIVNWAIQLPETWINNHIRAGVINETISTNTNIMQRFFKDELVHVPNPLSHLHGNSKKTQEKKNQYASIMFSINDLTKYFQLYLNKIEVNETLKNKYKTSNSITTDFKKTLETLIPDQKKSILEHRLPNQRGFLHIQRRQRVVSELEKTVYGFNPRETLSSPTLAHQFQVKLSFGYSYIGSEQYKIIESLQFENDSTTSSDFNVDPMRYFGVLARQESGKQLIVQTKPHIDSEKMTANAHKGAAAVKHIPCSILLNPQIQNLSLKPVNFDSKSKDFSSILEHPYIKKYFSDNFENYESHFKRVEGLTGYSIWEHPNHKESIKHFVLPDVSKQTNTPNIIANTQSVQNISMTNHTIKSARTLVLFFSDFQLDFNEPQFLHKKTTYMSEAVFFAQPNDNVLNTVIQGDVNEIFFKQILRETIHQYLQIINNLPTIIDLTLTLVYSGIGIYNALPILLQNSNVWSQFLIKEFPQYAKIFESNQFSRTFEITINRFLQDYTYSKVGIQSTISINCFNFLKKSSNFETQKHYDNYMTILKNVAASNINNVQNQTIINTTSEEIVNDLYKNQNTDIQPDFRIVHTKKMTEKSDSFKIESQQVLQPKRKAGRPRGSKNKKKH